MEHLSTECYLFYSWIPLVDINNEMALFLYFLIILFAFDTIFTIVVLITYILPAEMAITSKERASLMVYATYIGVIGFVLTFVVPLILLTGETTGIDLNFIIAMIIIGAACTVVMFIGSYHIKEYKFAQLEEPLGVIPAIKESFKNKPFIIFELSLFCIILAQTMLTTAVFYYVDFVLNLSGVMAIVPIIIVIGVMFAFAYFASKLIEKYGLKKVFIFGQITLGIGFVLTFFIGWSLNTVIISMVLIGIGLSILFMESPIILADTIDFDELKTDKRRETTYTGIEALITKPAISLGNWLFLVIISGYGFQERASTQSDTAILGIMIGFTIIPAIFIFLSAIIMKYYSLDGPEWTEQKLKLQGIHEKKEKEYLQHLKEQGKL